MLGLVKRIVAIGGAALILAAAGSGANAVVLIDQEGTVAPDGANSTEDNVTLTGGYISASGISWTHTYAPIVGTITAAELRVDMLDADGAVLRIVGDGSLIGDVGSPSHGGPGPWRDLSPEVIFPACTGATDGASCDNVFNLGAAFFPLLADGSFNIVGNEVGGLGIWGINRSLLTITYTPADAENASEPAMLALLGVGALGLAVARRRR